MTEIDINKPLNKISEGVNKVNESLSDLQKNVIDKNLEKLPLENVFTAMDQVNKIMDINLFGLGSISTLMGGKIIDFDKYKDNPLLKIIFNKYGGIDWLHKKYIQSVLEWVFKDHPEKKDMIKSMYENYARDKQTNICKETDPDSINVVCRLNLVSTDANQKVILDKIPDVKFSYLVQNITKELDAKKDNLNPDILTAAGCANVPTKQLADGTIVVDQDNASRDAKKTMETFLYTKIQQLSIDPWFIKDIPDRDSFVLSLMGSLFVRGNVYAESVVIKENKPTDFVAATTQPDTTVEETYTKEVKTSADFIDYVKWTILAHESGGNYGAVNKNDVGSVSLGLMQWHKERAQHLVKSLQAKDPIQFASIMWDGFKDLNLATLRDTPWTDDQATRFANLMKIDVFKKWMDEFVDTDITWYIKTAHEKWLTDPKVVVMYCNMMNAGPWWAENVLKEMDKLSPADKNNLQKLYETINQTDFLKKYPGVKTAYEKLYTKQLASISLPQLDFSQFA